MMTRSSMNTSMMTSSVSAPMANTMSRCAALNNSVMDTVNVSIIFIIGIISMIGIISLIRIISLVSVLASLLVALLGSLLISLLVVLLVSQLVSLQVQVPNTAVMVTH